MACNSCVPLLSSAVRVHDSQACRKVDVTRECICHILELREILLSFQTGSSFVIAAVVYAIPESISGVEPSSLHCLALTFGLPDPWHSLSENHCPLVTATDILHLCTF